MTAIHPQYIRDTAGKQLVVLPLHEFNALLEELDDQDDIRLYDEAQKDDSSEKISLYDYLEKRKMKNA